MSVIKEQWTFKRILKELFTTIVLIFIISQVINFIRQPEIKENIYAYSLRDIDNKNINFLDYKDKPLIVYFWGLWCPVCKLESSNIQSLSEEHTIVSIAVNSGTDQELSTYMKKQNLDYKVVNDRKGALAAKFDIDVYPTTLIYNAKGELKFTEVGYITTLGLKARLELIK
ncbi:MAG: Membrane protein, suppressor for copper-sensitivity ScsD [uncultured Sulfurovum sp.]|uniref:Membrane protein, suppressor for copper-sensitivity ScsD n=1 Tax=uncultured Sulfurovum sp. TaxID=269237 RepID=A0A6S6T3P1_9BACT|nr:MAG: Membrane protein, suppressor for copper-sensitivity ScsD [uncultured Sulfurovum sp.]